jgi:hypothetical protein
MGPLDPTALLSSRVPSPAAFGAIQRLGLNAEVLASFTQSSRSSAETSWGV